MTHPQTESKHSKAGISSLIVGGISMILLIAGSVLTVTLWDELPSNPDKYITMASFPVIAGTLGHMFGIALGVLGVLKKDRKKLMSIAGISVNVLAVIMACGIFGLIGIAVLS